MISHRSIVVVGMMVGLGAGCVGDPEGAARGALIYPESCRISGLGTLENADFAAGDLSGTASAGVGAWTHVTADGTVVQGSPDFVTCRINGVAIGDSRGPATLDGSTGYSYSLMVEDHYASSGGPTEEEGPTETQTLVASRRYSPSEWDEATLAIDGRAFVEIPAELPVTVGSAGNQWAWLRFQRAETLDEVTCRYRGTADGPLATDGATYALERCTGEWDGTDPVEAGSRVEVVSLTLHVHSGAHTTPADAPETTVSVDLQVTPIVVVDPDRDYYVLQVYDAAGATVLDRRGFVVAGDFVVESLD